MMKKLESRPSLVSLRLKSLADIFSEETLPEDEQLKETFTQALIVMNNYLGQPASPFTATSLQLYPYILHLCENLDPTDKKTIARKYQNMQSCERNEIQVKTEICEATLSVSSKLSEFSHAFVKLWVNEKNIQYTTASPRENPVRWNESFVFDVEDYGTETLNFEFWISRTTDVEEALKNLKVERRKKTPKWKLKILPIVGSPYSEETVHLLGKASEEIKNFPSVACELNLSLTSVDSTMFNPLLSEVKVTLELYARKNYFHSYHLHQHIILLRNCYEKQLATQQYNCLWRTWLEILPAPALTLMHQHAIQYGLTMAEQTLCSWIVTSVLKINTERRLSYALLRSLLEDMAEYCSEDPPEYPVLQAYYKSCEKFMAFASDQLTNLHEKFSWSTTENADELFEMLRCVTLGKPEDSADFMESFNKILQEEGQRWYLSVIHENNEEIKDSNRVITIAEGIKSVTKKFITNQIYLDDIFERAWNLNYTELTLPFLNSTIINSIKPKIILLVKRTHSFALSSKEEKLMKMLQVYHIFRNLVEYLISKQPENTPQLAITDYPTWFGETMILEWFLLSTKEAGPFIKRAVEYDKIEPIDEHMKHGTSAPDVVNIIDEMVLVIWLKMEWEEQFYTHSALVEAVNFCAVEYVKDISERTVKANFFYGQPEFVINKSLCVALSNVFCLYDHLRIIEAKVRKVINAAEEIFSFAMVDQTEIVQHELLTAMSDIFHLVMQKIKQKFVILYNQMLKVKEENARRKAVNTLCNHTEQALEIMYKNLNAEPFIVMLRALWISILETLLKKTKKPYFSLFKQKSKESPKAISSTLSTLQCIFYCNGKGLTYYEMQNQIYMELKQFLQKQEKNMMAQKIKAVTQ